MSDTPRTDQWEVDLRECISIEYPGTGHKSPARKYVPASFARQLERELAAADADNKALAFNSEGMIKRLREELAVAQSTSRTHAAAHDAERARRKQAEAALSRFEQAELPEEPSGVQFVRNDVRGYGREAINYIDALRAHAARMTVERDEAKERAEKAETERNSYKINATVYKQRAEENARMYQYLRGVYYWDAEIGDRCAEMYAEDIAVIDADLKAVLAAHSEEGKC